MSGHHEQAILQKFALNAKALIGIGREKRNREDEKEVGKCQSQESKLLIRK